MYKQYTHLFEKMFELVSQIESPLSLIFFKRYFLSRALTADLSHCDELLDLVSLYGPILQTQE